MKIINSFRSKLLALTLALMSGVASFAYDYHGDLLCYNILTDSTVAVTGQSEYKTMPRYEYLPENLVIPAEVTLQGKTYKVVSIDQWAFYACAMLKSVIIPHTVTFIGMSAFHYCENLADVYIPYSVTTVEGSAFAYTKWYDNLPDGEVYINNTLYRYKGTAPENTQIVVKDGTTRIAGFTFWNQSNIISIELPQTLTVIEHDAFEGCTQLSSILIPKNVTDIGASAFADCTSLTEVICLAPTPPTMGQYANPSANSEIFARVDVSNATLNVRSESVEAYKNADQWKEFGQILPIKPITIEDQFPTLWGLQRTVCNEYCGESEEDNSANVTYKHTFDYIRVTSEYKPYILCNGYSLREEDNKVLIYSHILNKDLVLYDFTLEVGDSLPALYIDYYPHSDVDLMAQNVVDYNKDGRNGTIYPADTFVVTDISSVTLLDGNQYKKWTFDNGMEYVEGIGMYGGSRNGNFFGLIQKVVVPCHTGEHLVCASRNGKLLYQMDDTEMERLGTECLCEVETSYKSQWCDTWNVLELKYRYSSYTTKEDFETWRYYLAQDTIINNYTYKAVTRQTTKVPEGVYPFTIPEPEYVAAVRFTDDRKVYIYYDNTEYLLYDFNVQPGDELTVFAGINHYQSHHTNTIRVYEVERDESVVYGTKVSLTVIPDFYGDIVPTCAGETKWIEGVGDLCGFVTGADCGLSEDQSVLLCAYKDGNTEYTTGLEEYAEYGCEYNTAEDKEYTLTLPGLQRTVCNEYCEDSKTSLQKFEEIRFEHGQPYIYCYSAFLIREENNKILIYSHSLDKDLVLYDFTLEVGDSLPRLYLDESAENDLYWIYYDIMNVVDYHKDDAGNILPADTLIVTDVSAITLLDGKEYKKWTFNNGMEYVEGIGCFGNNNWSGDFFRLIGNMGIPACLHGEHLVCVSKNNKLLYQMDPVKMDELGAECLCDYNGGPRRDHAKNGKIGGRPTPTQWNMLEVETKEMDGTPTIVRAETFSYTLENDSIVTKGKTFYQLARQSTKDTAITKSFVGALHFGEDEDNRVYFLRDGVEYVLYDFTAEPGDTIEIFAGINNYPQYTTYTHVVTGKDTLENGACRMMLEVVLPEETASIENAQKVWLAGLGSIDGIVHNAAKRTSDAHAAPAKSASSETQTSVMLCAWREDSCLYTTNHPEYDTFGCVYNQDPTALESPTSPSSYQKILREGQLLIMHDGKIYTIMGIEIK